MFATERESLSVRVAARVARAITVVLTEAGIRRRRTASGELEPRAWGRLLCVLGSLLAALAVWTSLHIVAPGSVGVPVTLGRPGQAIPAGFHLTWPFTSVATMTIRTQNYLMTANPTKTPGTTTDDAVPVLGADGARALVNATVLFRLDPRRATEVYRTLGTRYVTTVVRPFARTCIRSEFAHYSTVVAATMEWHRVQANVTACMRRGIEPQGLSRCSQAQLTPEYLQFTYIQALAQLVSSPSSSTIVLPFDQNLTPLVNVPSK